MSTRGCNLHVTAGAGLHASRLMKQTASLSRSGLFDRVLICAEGYLGGSPMAEEEIIDANRVLWRLTRIWSHRLPPGWFIWGVVKRLERLLRRLAHYRGKSISVVTPHSIGQLPMGVAFKRAYGSRLIYDAHELETETYGLYGWNKVRAKFLECLLIRECDAVVCVADTIADAYQREYGIARPTVVRNIPELMAGECFADRGVLRRRLGIPVGERILLYHGGLGPGRRIDRLLDVFKATQPGWHMVFMGNGELASSIQETARTSPSVHFLPAVPIGELLSHVAGADVGFCGHLEPDCLNHRFALPNKLFESLSAGVPVICYPEHEEIRRIVRRYGCGWVLPGDQGDLGEWLRSVTTGEILCRRAGAEHARAELTWGTEASKLVELYRRHS